MNPYDFLFCYSYYMGPDRYLQSIKERGRWTTRIPMLRAGLAMDLHLFLLMGVAERLFGFKLTWVLPWTRPEDALIVLMLLWSTIFVLLYPKRIPALLKETRRRDFTDRSSVIKNFVLLWLPLLIIVYHSIR